MHLYTHCKFCACELPTGANRYKAYCNTECKKLANKYGTVRNMQIGKDRDRTPNRKTPRRQNPHQVIKVSTVATVMAKNGSIHKQYGFEFDVPVSKTPLVLTGGSIPPKNEDNQP